MKRVEIQVGVIDQYNVPGAAARTGNEYQHALYFLDLNDLVVGGIDTSGWSVTDWAAFVWKGQNPANGNANLGTGMRGLYIDSMCLRYIKVTGPGNLFLERTYGADDQRGTRQMPGSGPTAPVAWAPAPLMLNIMKRTDSRRRNGMVQVPAYSPTDVSPDGKTTPIAAGLGVAFGVWVDAIRTAGIPMATKSPSTTQAAVVTSAYTNPLIGIRKTRRGV